MRKTLLNTNLKSVFALCATAFVVFSLNSCTPKSSENSQKTETSKVISSGSIVYFNLDKVIANYDMANELKATVSSKVKGIQDEINRRGNKLQSEFDAFNEKLQKGLITRTVAEVQGTDLQKKKNDFNVYTANKEREIAEEQQVMLNQIGDSIKKFLDKYNEDKKYSLIITTQGDILPAPVVAGDSSLDITQDIIEKLNDEYIKNKEKGIVPSLEHKAEEKK